VSVPAEKIKPSVVEGLAKDSDPAERFRVARLVRLFAELATGVVCVTVMPEKLITASTAEVGTPLVQLVARFQSPLTAAFQAAVAGTVRSSSDSNESRRGTRTGRRAVG